MTIKRRAMAIVLATALLLSMFTVLAQAEGSPDRIGIKADIDGRSVLCYKEGFLWWEHYEYQVPKGIEIDGEAWAPEWHNEYIESTGMTAWVSDKLSVGDKYKYFVSLQAMQGRERLELAELPSGRNGGVLKILFDDNNSGGDDAYRCDIYLQEYPWIMDTSAFGVTPPSGGSLRPGQNISAELYCSNMEITWAELSCEGPMIMFPAMRLEPVNPAGNRVRVEFDMSALPEELYDAGTLSFTLRGHTDYGTFDFKTFTINPTNSYGEAESWTRTLAAGDGFMMALLADGSLWSWGKNEQGQLGDGTFEDRAAPFMILDGVRSVVCGRDHTLALKNDGTVWAWGENYNSQVGSFGNASISVPRKVFDGAKAVFAGFDSSGALKENGELMVWGVVPGVSWQEREPLLRMEDVADCAFGNGFALILQSNGKLWGQGVNSEGQLANSSLRDTNYDESYFIMDDVVSVAAGASHSLAVTRFGVLLGWGNNNNDKITQSWNLPGGENPSITAPTYIASNAIRAYASQDASYAILRTPPTAARGASAANTPGAEKGTLTAWGYTGDINNSARGYDDFGGLIIAEDVVCAAVYNYSAAFVKQDGSVTVYGGNTTGQFGEGRQNAWPANVGIGDVKGISAGLFHSLVVTKDGGLYTMGPNWHGIYGDGTMTSEWDFGAAGEAPVKVMDGADSAAAGAYHSYAVMKNGDLYAWGDNRSGQLGNGETGWGKEKTSPVKIMDGVKSVAAGYYHALAVKTDGSLWTWGYNYYGQLGDGTTVNSLTPKKLMEDVAFVSASKNQSFAVKTDGSLLAWGENYYGQIGDGTSTAKLEPVKIMDGVKYVYAGYNHTLAVKTDGSLFAWGANYEGQLGDGTTKAKNTPTAVMDGVAFAGAGASHSVAVKTDGSLLAWGGNNYGQLGDGTTQLRTAPVAVMDGITAVSAGDYDGYTLAVDEGGELYAWGNNPWGQLGFPIYGRPQLEAPVRFPERINQIEDIYPPVIHSVSPDGGRYRGTVGINVSAGDNRGLESLRLLVTVDGGATWTEHATLYCGGEQSLSTVLDLNTALFRDGWLDFKVVARDVSGLEAESGTLAILGDNTPPAVPSGVAVTPALDKITIAWAANSEPDLKSYTLFRAETEGGPYTALLSGAGRTYTDTNVEIKKTYYYYLQAADDLGNISAMSEAFPAQTLPDTEAPIVVGITPANGSWMTGVQNVTVTAQDNFRLLSIELQTSPDDGKTWVKSMELPTSPGTYASKTFEFNSKAFGDGPLTLRAIAYDTWGNPSDGYPIRYYQVDNTPPAKVEGFSFESTTTAITLRWNDVPDQDLAHFRLEMMKDGEFVKVADVSSTLGYNLTGLDPDKSMVFRVAAVDRAGNVGLWSELTASTIKDTFAPAVTAISPAPAAFSASIPLSVTAKDDHKIVKIVLQTSPNGSVWADYMTFDSFTPSPSVTITHSLALGDFPEGALFVRAIATDASGNRSLSDSSAPFNEYRVDRTPPAAPSGVTASGSVGYIEVKWGKNAEADLAGYNVYRAASESGAYEKVASLLKTQNFIDRNTAQGETYYYRLSAQDLAGNEGARSAAASALAPIDTQAPEILSISPADGGDIGRSAKISVLAFDNNMLSSISADYRVVGGEWTPIGEQRTNAQSYTWQLTLDTQAIGEKRIELRAVAVDAAGNRGAYKSVEYSIDLTPPRAPALSAAPGPMSVSLSWDSANEQDLAGFKIYRKTPAQQSYALIAQIPRIFMQYAYTDKNVDVAQTYSYRVEAVDICGNMSFAESAYVAPVNTDVYAPIARMLAPSMAEAGAVVFFDGSLSTDNVGVHAYAWDFGDGESASTAKPSHVFSASGTYTVKLTVSDFAGHLNTAEAVINVYNKGDLGAATIRIMDEAGEPVPNAKVYLNLGAPEPEIISANAQGVVELRRLPGSYTIGVYADKYLPAKKDVTLEAGKAQEVRFNLVKSEIVVGELTFHRMTLEEIIAAGINIYDPANQNVFRFEITLTYGEQTITRPIVVNDYGQVLSGGEPFIFEEYPGAGGGRVCTPVVVPSGGGGTKPLVVIIDLPGQATWLKDFFDVNLHLINKADAEFALVNCEATLNIPEGLTLMENTTASGTAKVDIGTIRGQEAKDIRWILRGDKDGSYDLSADFFGLLDGFNEEIRAKFVAANPLVVEAAEGLSLEAVVQDRIIYGRDGWIKLGLVNSGQKTVNMPNLFLEVGTQTAKYKTSGGQPVQTPMETLLPGETLWVEYTFPTGLFETNIELYLQSAVIKAIGGNVELPCTFRVAREAEITKVALPVSNFVAGYAANVRLDVLGNKLSGIPVTARLVDAHGATVYTGAQVTGSDAFSILLKLTAEDMKSLPAGSYSAFAETKDGMTAASAVFTVEALPTDIWTMSLLARAEDGKLLAVFHTDTTAKNGVFTVKVGGADKAYRQEGNALIIDHTPAAGDTVVVGGVKFAKLFPSYSFTFTSVFGK